MEACAMCAWMREETNNLVYVHNAVVLGPWPILP